MEDPSGCTPWDILDFAFAANSWRNFISNPSWSSFGIALLDTVGCFPLVPSTGSIRTALKVVDKVSDINPNKIRYSQSSVNGAENIVQSMKQNGWRGAAIDVVRMPDSKLTTIDNTRVLAARKVGIDVKANVYNYDELLPNSGLIERFTTKKGIPQTWGDAVNLRIGKQNSQYRKLYPNGSNIIGWDGK